MTQFDFGDIVSPITGTALIDGTLEPWRDALNSGHSGSSRPDYAVAGMKWVDTTTSTWLLKTFTGTVDVIEGHINTSNNTHVSYGAVRAAIADGGTLQALNGTVCLTWGAGNVADLTAGADIEMDTNKITGLGNPTDDQDAATKKYVDGAVNVIGSIGGGTQDIDLDAGRTVTGTVDTSTTTFTFSNPLTAGTPDAFDIYLTNGGSQTINWPASVDWTDGTAPDLTAAGLDHLVFTTINGGTTWYGYVAGLDMS